MTRIYRGLPTNWERDVHRMFYINMSNHISLPLLLIFAPHFSHSSQLILMYKKVWIRRPHVVNSERTNKCASLLLRARDTKWLLEIKKINITKLHFAARFSTLCSPQPLIEQLKRIAKWQLYVTHLTRGPFSDEVGRVPCVFARFIKKFYKWKLWLF